MYTIQTNKLSFLIFFNIHNGVNGCSSKLGDKHTHDKSSAVIG